MKDSRYYVRVYYEFIDGLLGFTRFVNRLIF
jgi:hypothetical protein